MRKRATKVHSIDHPIGHPWSESKYQIEEWSPDNLCTADDKGAVTPQQISRKILYLREDIGSGLVELGCEGIVSTGG